MQVRVARQSLTLALRRLLAPDAGAAPSFRTERLRLRSRDALVTVTDGAAALELRLVPRDPRAPGPRDAAWSRHFLLLVDDRPSSPAAAALRAAVAAHLREADRAPLEPLLAAALGDAPQLTVALPGDCGQACRFCRDAPRPGLRWPRPGRGREDAVAAARAALAAGRPAYRRVLFQGHDALAAPTLPDLVRAADALGYEGVAVLTPGARLGDGALAERLVAAGLDTLEVALYGADAAAHDGVTRTPGSFARLRRGLERVRRADVHVVVHTALLDATLPRLPAIAALCDDLGLTFERAEGIAADHGQEARFRACAPPLAAVRAALAAAAPALPQPFTLVDLPDCALNPPVPGLSVVRRPPTTQRRPARHASVCAGCARRRSCPGPSEAALAVHGAEDLCPFP
jgi:cyclic pyranopterin phosphate synthase